MFGKLGVVVGLLVLALTVAPAGTPVQVSYVYSDSMEPTIATNDGFLLVAGGTPAVGDVVTFRAPRRDGYVTHRIVGRTDAGFITRGDANPTTDQAAGASPVPRDAIVGTVLTVDGEPVTIPEYGTAVATLRRHGRLVSLAVGALLLVQTLGATARTRPQRSVVRVADVLTPLFVGCLLAAIVVMYLGAAVHQSTFVAVAVPTQAPQTLTVGEPKTVEFVAERSTSPFTRTVTSADGMRIVSRTGNDTHVVVTARVPPPSEPGRYTVRLTRRQYPAVVPGPVVRQLSRIHPVLAVGVTALLTLVPLYAGARMLVDGATPVRPSRRRWRRRLNEVWR